MKQKQYILLISPYSLFYFTQSDFCMQCSPNSMLGIWFYFNQPCPENPLPAMAGMLLSLSEITWTHVKNSYIGSWPEHLRGFQVTHLLWVFLRLMGNHSRKTRQSRFMSAGRNFYQIKTLSKMDARQLTHGWTIWCIHATEYYLAIKSNEVLIHTTTGMDFENIIRSERSQS